MATIQTLGKCGISFLREELARFGGIRAILGSSVSEAWYAYAYWPYPIEVNEPSTFSTGCIWNPRDRQQTPEEGIHTALALESIRNYLVHEPRHVMMVQCPYSRAKFNSDGTLDGSSDECLVQYYRQDGSAPVGSDPEIWTVLVGGAAKVEAVKTTISDGMLWPPMLGFIAETTLDIEFVHGMTLSHAAVVDLVRGVSAIFIYVFDEQLLMLCSPT